MVAVISKDKFLSLKESKNITGYTIKFREDPVYLDPRHADLGGRMITNLEKLHLSLKLLNLKSSEVREYYTLSSSLGIPQINTNKLQNNIFGIECNLEELNGIDFKKGCYIGQENTARIKLKNKLLKRLFSIQIIKGNILGDNIINDNDIEVGKILIKDKFPFAVIKFKNKDFSFVKNYKCGEAIIKVNKPYWLN